MPPTKTSPKKKNSAARTRVYEPVVEIEEEVPKERVPETGAPTWRRGLLYGLLAVAIFAGGLFSGYMLWEYKPVPKPTIYTIETKGFPSMGPADAPIVIVEFSDYQCPYCWSWYAQVLKPLMATYPNKIRFVYRNFPLYSIHPNAVSSAEAALCAGEQDAYWPFHNLLFESYRDLYEQDRSRVLDQAAYNQLAGHLGLNVAAFEKCMTSQKYQQFIVDDLQYANSLPPDKVLGENGEIVEEPAVGGTPTFFVNGHRLGGAYPLEKFKEIIDAELEKVD